MDPVEKAQRDLEEIRAMRQEAERHIKEMREMVREVDEIILAWRPSMSKRNAPLDKQPWWRWRYE